MVEIREYLDANGKALFSIWLNELRDPQARARIRVRINRLRLGLFGDCKPLGGGIVELRVDYGPGYRVYFGHIEQAIVLILGGGSKKTQRRDIGIARRCWADYKANERD